MRNVPSLPWWGWALIAFFVLNVLLDVNTGILVPIILGWIAAGMLGQRRRDQHRSVPNGQDEPPPPPLQQPDRPGPGWAGGSDAGGTAPPPTGPVGQRPTDSSAGDPGHSPWVHRPGERPGAGATPARGTPGSGMPRIEVPQYPDGTTPPAAYPPSGTNPSTDPVVSLGQLHLSRCARDLHAAATTGSSADVARVLAEVGDQADRLLAQLGGSGAMPGSGRREFEAGLRRLQRDVLAARGEDPPGAKVSRVVQAAGSMGQTGRYE